MSRLDLQVEVRDDEIIVTLPGTRDTVTYYKPVDSPRPIARQYPVRDDPNTPIDDVARLDAIVVSDGSQHSGVVQTSPYGFRVPPAEC
jgi:hypothetical protein